MSIKRSSGILLPISALPSDYGIGSLGKQAIKFVDFLVKAKQSYWQMLPLGPTSYGDSPYSSFSSYAGNPYFIDLDLLIEDGLLTKNDVKDLRNDKYIEYGYLYETRYIVLKNAYLAGIKKYNKEFNDFCNENSNWLDDYADYMSIKKYFGNVSWIDWPEKDIRFRKPEALAKYRVLLKEDIEFYKFMQYLFFKQFNALKKYANDKGIKIIGDLPIYVAMDSADVWANKECFQLDDQYVPTEVSGVPPDYFSEDGQLWGNPLYNWSYIKSTGYKFWIDRVGGTSKLFDVVRIDHFRGFASYWAVPYGNKTAKIGRWVNGPRMDLIGLLQNWFHNVEFIAEDLGTYTEDVGQLMKDCKLPGMKVLEFGFEASGPTSHTPFTYGSTNCICYTGTHDNSTVLGWKALASKKDIEYSMDYMNITEDDDFALAMIKEGMKSIANLFVAQIQDYLGLDDASRINTPGTVGNNWKWRLDKEDINDELANKIAKLTSLYGRAK